MSHFLIGLGRLLLLLVATTTLANSTNPVTRQTEDNSKAAFVSRLHSLKLPLRTNSTDAHLQEKIADYLDHGSNSTERMLGRANQYFPIFDYYLRKHGMPASLKYLAVAESMLVPGAVSTARAAGLWQLMPATAREMGLRVDGTVDERLDIHRSTEAAVLMLKDLYSQFGDWQLAMAAYNCGPGRVRRAVRQSGGYTHYPKVKKFLPTESQKYVAAYIAAAYALNYYGEYGLTPDEHVSFDYIRVFKSLSLYRAAKNCGIDLAHFRRMNPSFVRGLVPASTRGYQLRVSEANKYALQQYVWGRPNLVELPRSEDYDNAVSTASLAGFNARAVLLGCSPERLVYAAPAQAMLRMEETLLFGFAESYRAVAMN